MSDTRAPAPPAPLVQAPAPPAAAEPRKLDDVLLAMDVVDTLRHRERIVDMELSAEAREEQLVVRLKEIYDAQGIEVPDRILRDGVKALEEQRFVYKPAQDGLSVKLARLYVNRKSWLPAAMTVTGGVAALLVGWQVFWAMPQAAELRALPAEIAELVQQGQALATDAEVDARIASVGASAATALDNGDRGSARDAAKWLRDTNRVLSAEYDLRIVSRPGEDTGFWRTPENSPNARNYYLVVEAVAPGGGLVKVPVQNEETQKTENVAKWAQRVSEETFNRVAEDKRGDQIVQNDILGRKPRGQLEPVFDAPTPGGAITSW